MSKLPLSDEEDFAATFAAMRSRARRRTMRNLGRKVPAVIVMLLAWMLTIALGLHWLPAAIPAAFLGAAVYQAAEKLLPEQDD